MVTQNAVFSLQQILSPTSPQQTELLTLPKEYQRSMSEKQLTFVVGSSFTPQTTSSQACD